MNLSIPLYVEELKVPDSPAPQFVLRPLFFSAPSVVGQNLGAATNKLARVLRQLLDQLARQPRQDALVPWSFSPALTEDQVKFTAPLRRQTADCRFLVVSFEAPGRRLGVVPALDGLWFDVERGQRVATRAREVITQHLRTLEKEQGDGFSAARWAATGCRAWLSTLDLDVHPRPELQREGIEGLLGILSGEKPDGRVELHKVGRCLDWLYPDDLERVVRRDGEVAELTRLLAAPDRRPVLVAGPRRVGKTALIQEAVFRRVDAHRQPHINERNVWLLAPPRLISGMSYVGQWESRLLAILEEAKAWDHVLYFDDVLGLFHAGVSADSELNVAAVLRPWVERRDVRVLAEITPEALRVFRERDRGLADQFHVLPLREPPEAETRRVLVHVMRQLEGRHRCVFDPEVIPTVTELTARHVPDQAMPGKGAAFLAQLALKAPGRELTRADALADFQARSGLSVAFLDTAQRLERKEVVAALSKQIVGQDAALQALADVVTIAKARLNDPGRPLGTFLFLGPTGVGKTQCAKALAAYLYGDEARLLRFDMNEYVDPASVQRLTGTFRQPDGLLTSAVRRQPFCVVLLDEIEKAHPDVSDLLLQVLGEGRLTDSLGRTSDFTGAIIVMTSNLGTRQAASSFGLRPGDEADRARVFLEAARDFFRPEFFNRLDRVVPFGELTRPHVQAIAEQLITALLGREGLVHRRCVLDIDPAAMARIVDQGYHPQLGARALKRAIERQITQPIAARLASLAPGAPTVLSVFPAGEGVSARAQVLAAPTPHPLPAAPDPADADALLDAADAFVELVEADVEHPSGPTLRAGADDLTPGVLRYLAVREQMKRITDLVERIAHAGPRGPRSGRAIGAGSRTRAGPPAPARLLRVPAEEFAAALADGELQARLARLVAMPVPLPADRRQGMLAELTEECALLDVMVPPPGDPAAPVGPGPAAPADGGQATAGGQAPAAPPRPAIDRVLLCLRCVGVPGHALLRRLADAYAQVFAGRNGFVVTRLDTLDWSARPQPGGAVAAQFLLLEMPGITAVLNGEHGTHLLCPPHENIVPVQAHVAALGEGEDAAGAARHYLAARASWRAAVAAGDASPDADPHPLGAVVRVYAPDSATLDLRTGLMGPGFATAEQLRGFLLARLPVPADLAV